MAWIIWDNILIKHLQKKSFEKVISLPKKSFEKIDTL